MRRITQGLVYTVLLLGISGPAVANEFTDVIDAFDTEIGDPWDVNLRVGYERFYKQGLIRRETYNPEQGELHSWDYFAYRDMFEYTQVSHILHLDLDIGIYKDIAIKVRLPLILNDSRELKAKDNMQWSDVTGDGEGDSLFPLPFKSPERSGLDFLAVGLWWGILAQERDDTKPDWTIYIEGRFAVGDPLQASCQSAGNTSCDDRKDQGENWYKTKGGISRGINEIAFGTRLSRRYGLFDPYFGFEALVGFAQEGTPFKIVNNADGQINDMPPIVGTLSFGMELVPWEVPKEYRKFVIGIGGTGKYHSEGREYTPLFDALGMSPFFNNQEYVDFNGNGENDGGEEEAATADDVWSGMTDVENYATFYGTLFAMIQPAKYVKFKLGINVGHESEHFITKTDQCPADKMLSDGTCQMYNWGHRPAVDTPGNRFRIEQTLMWSLFIDAIAMF
ncbi:MAG: hypothetical protein JRF63_08465 [Deltaproteobacteria bacterium]|nr:hypothetical protein [Deltaproteobacteria bacterium]